MALDIDEIMARVTSHAQSLGVFDEVNGHEPKNAPGRGVTAAVWVQEVDPVSGMSGLASTSIRLGLLVRLYTGMISEAPDAIDPNLIKALDALCAAYNGDFTLDGLIEQVDIFGAYGDSMRGRAGYLNQDGRMFRVMDLTVPLIVSDLWDQEATA